MNKLVEEMNNSKTTVNNSKTTVYNVTENVKFLVQDNKKIVQITMNSKNSASYQMLQADFMARKSNAQMRATESKRAEKPLIRRKI